MAWQRLICVAFPSQCLSQISDCKSVTTKPQDQVKTVSIFRRLWPLGNFDSERGDVSCFYSNFGFRWIYLNFGFRWLCSNLGFRWICPNSGVWCFVQTSVLGMFVQTSVFGVFVQISVFGDFVQTPMFDQKKKQSLKNQCFMKTGFWRETGVWQKLKTGVSIKTWDW